MTAVLEVQGLTTRFATPDGEVLAADEVGFTIGPGESLGVVGESGSGKTQIFLSIMGLLAKNGRSTGSVRYHGKEILNLPAGQLNEFRGDELAMIFQDPMTSLNPFLKISRQMTEVLREHKGLGEAEARKRGIAMLELVGIPEAARRFDMYPHEFSGGMRQRVMIAMSLLCEPDLLIADEPTTALDVTVQAQILELLARLKRELGMAIALITHDLGVVAGLCERVMVMYAGRAVEVAPADLLFRDPQHPYTKGLLLSMPRLDEAVSHHELATIPGQPPNLQALPKGCVFADRCPYVFERCRAERPALAPNAPSRLKACHLERLQ
ncbi:MAG: ABC transporter ATP-binding protein [Geminicoccaceae bacterium]